MALADIHRQLTSYRPDLSTIADLLNGMTPQERVAICRSLSPYHQRCLFEAAKGFRAVDLDYFCPSSRQALVGLPHDGKNSLPIPALTRFQKVFCNPDRATAVPERWGYNNFHLSQYVGPGYYVARDCGDGEVVIDYFLIPPAKPADWPDIRSNGEGLSRFVYFQTRDYMRGVSDHVSIGRATRNGKLMDNWFVLCRTSEGPSAS